jgi:hypothetical protein
MAKLKPKGIKRGIFRQILTKRAGFLFQIFALWRKYLIFFIGVISEELEVSHKALIYRITGGLYADENNETL